MGYYKLKDEYKKQKFVKSQIDRKFLDSLHFKNVSVKKFKEKVLPNVDYSVEIRGKLDSDDQFRHCKVYSLYDICDYINKVIDEKKRDKK